MNQQKILELIKKKAARDRRNRKDRRFLDTMGFLVAKGFLRANFDLPYLPNQRLDLRDALWAGENVEPRILEVLPAAVLRLEKHFYFAPLEHPRLLAVVRQLRERHEKGDAFLGVPYEKLKVWADLPLRDGRVKSTAMKKRVRTFRLTPETLEKLNAQARKRGLSQTQVIEKLIKLAP